MTTPEIKAPESPVVENATDYEPSVMEQGEGVVSTPSQAQPTTVQINDQAQATVQPVPAPSDGASLQIPVDPKVLKDQSKGDVGDSSTWFAVYWLRAIKRAVKQGFAIIVGGRPNA